MVTETTVAVRFPDVDPMGIVHHAVYPIWYELGRMDWLSAAGMSYADSKQFGLNPTMVSLNLTYKAPVTYPETVTVRTRCTAFGPRKLELTYETVRSDGTIANTATTFHIWTGPDNKTIDLSVAYPNYYASIRSYVGAEFETL